MTLSKNARRVLEFISRAEAEGIYESDNPVPVHFPFVPRGFLLLILQYGKPPMSEQKAEGVLR